MSYSRHDIDEVRAFVDFLQSRIPDLNIWFDVTGIESGDEFAEKIITAIDGSDCVIFALSDSSIKSKWAKNEIMYAKNIGKRVIPLLLTGSRLKGWFLFTFGRIDCIKINSKLQVDKLLRNLSNWSNKPMANVLNLVGEAPQEVEDHPEAPTVPAQEETIVPAPPTVPVQKETIVPAPPTVPVQKETIVPAPPTVPIQTEKILPKPPVVVAKQKKHRVTVSEIIGDIKQALRLGNKGKRQSSSVKSNRKSTHSRRYKVVKYSLISLCVIALLIVGANTIFLKSEFLTSVMAELGWAKAEYYMGLEYSYDDSDAARYYKKAAQQGYVEAQEELASMYFEGRGVAQDYSEALRLWRDIYTYQLDDASFTPGYYKLKIAECYQHLEKWIEALDWYMDLADDEKEYALIQASIGDCYMHLEQYEEAFSWYKKAAEQDSMYAQRLTGIFYCYGYGVEQDINEGVNWLKKASSQGDEIATSLLQSIRNHVDSSRSRGDNFEIESSEDSDYVEDAPAVE